MKTIDIAKVQSLWEAKLSIERIANITGLSMDAVRRLGLPKRTMRGYQPGMTILQLRQKEADEKRHPRPVTEDVRRLVERFAVVGP